MQTLSSPAAYVYCTCRAIFAWRYSHTLAKTISGIKIIGTVESEKCKVIQIGDAMTHFFKALPPPKNPFTAVTTERCSRA